MRFQMITRYDKAHTLKAIKIEGNIEEVKTDKTSSDSNEKK